MSWVFPKGCFLARLAVKQSLKQALGSYWRHSVTQPQNLSMDMIHTFGKAWLHQGMLGILVLL